MSRLDRAIDLLFNKIRITYSKVNCWTDYDTVQGIYRLWIGWIIWHIVFKIEKLEVIKTRGETHIQNHKEDDGDID